MSSKEERLIYLIFTVQQKLRIYIRDELRAAGIKCTLVQSGILFLLKEKSGRTMSELAQLLSLDNSTITGLVDRLEKSGSVQRKANPKDRRMSQIYITAQGNQEAQMAKKIINRVNKEIKASFSNNEMKAFKKVLNSLVIRL